MEATQVKQILAANTKLKPKQLGNLTKLITQFEEVDELLYQAIGLLNSGVKYTQLKTDFTQGRYGWENSAYKHQQEMRAFRDNMLSKPPEVREGEIECSRCHQRRTVIIEQQTRSADEGCTYWIICANPQCKHREKQ